MSEEDGSDNLSRPDSVHQKALRAEPELPRERSNLASRQQLQPVPQKPRLPSQWPRSGPSHRSHFPAITANTCLPLAPLPTGSLIDGKRLTREI